MRITGPAVFTLLSLVVPCLSAQDDSRANARLLHSPSAYLRQHAHQPIDWYPWGEEALARAKQENKLIFVSVGYSTCHWCHVMARESFSDEAVAQVLNEHFICIKVDRDERPDLDRRFITFLESTAGSAGWPASIWLTPDAQPFFGTTYVPKEDEAGSPGFLTLSRRLAQLWRDQPDAVRGQAQLVSSPEVERPAPASTPSDGALLRRNWVRAVRTTYDAQKGGFECAPKFPNAVILSALLQVEEVGDDAPSPRTMALHTLRQIARSGLHDLLGGGFHRYAVDADWHVPHFEKLLSDQALLLSAYTDAWLLTGEPEFEATLRQTLSGLRTFRLPGGGLASAFDADSHDEKGVHREGAYYVWTWEELLRIQNSDTLARTAPSLGLAPEGNIPSSVEGFVPGANLLDPVDDRPWSATLTDESSALLAGLRQARLARPAPWRDDTELCGPNALAASGLAKAALALGDPDARAEALALGEHLRDQHWDSASRRLSRLSRSSAPPLAFADDYAFTVAAALDLHQLSQDPTWLEWAVELQRTQDALFIQEKGTGYFNEASDAGITPRRLDRTDRAEPSPHGVTVLNLLRLAALAGDESYRKQARLLWDGASAEVAAVPAAHPLLAAVSRWVEGSPASVLITGPAKDPVADALFLAATRRPLWAGTVLRITPETWASYQRLNPELEAMLPEGASTVGAVVCENRRCLPPTFSPAELSRLLQLPSSTTP